LKLTIIGSGTAAPQIERSAPCCLIQGNGKNIVADLGPGSSRGLLIHGGVAVGEVGLVILSHLHPDHCSDLAPFLFALRAGEPGRREPLMIVGPEGVEEHYRGLRRIWGHRVEAKGYDLSVIDWVGGDLKWGGFTFRAAVTFHSTRNLAWYVGRPEGGGIILTGDGEGSEELVDLGRSSHHILVAECSLPAGKVSPGHMNPAQAGGLAGRCGSAMLVLTHLNPDVEPGPARAEAEKHFGGEVIVAEDGMVIEIG
jgi:ribonuclease BN (tRNA processing enzyme)